MRINNRIESIFSKMSKLTETAPAAPAGGSGGGVATAPAPAPAAPSAPAAAPAASAPSAPSFGPPSLSRIKDALAAPAAAPSAAVASPPEQNVSLAQGQDGKWHAKDDATGAEIGAGYESQEAAIAHLKTLEASSKPGAAAIPGAVSDPLDTPFASPLMNGIKTPREAQAALLRSQQEAQRLFYEEVKPLQEARKKLEQDIADRDSRLAAIQAELETARTTPPFKELTQEELSALAKENPLESQKYLTEKGFRDRDAQAAKERAGRAAQQQRDYYSKLKVEIDKNYDSMSANEKDFPLFKDLGPLMDTIANETQTFRGADGKMHSPLLGHAWSPKIAYLAAYGQACLQARETGDAAKTAAAETARLTAEAAARATGGGAQPGAGAGSGAAEGDPAKKADKSYKDALRAAGTSHNFFQRRSP